MRYIECDLLTQSIPFHNGYFDDILLPSGLPSETPLPLQESRQRHRSCSSPVHFAGGRSRTRAYRYGRGVSGLSENSALIILGLEVEASIVSMISSLHALKYLASLES